MDETSLRQEWNRKGHSNYNNGTLIPVYELVGGAGYTANITALLPRKVQCVEEMGSLNPLDISFYTDKRECGTLSQAKWDRIANAIEMDINVICGDSLDLPKTAMEYPPGLNVIVSCSSETMAHKFNKQFAETRAGFVGMKHAVHVIDDELYMCTNGMKIMDLRGGHIVDRCQTVECCQRAHAAYKASYRKGLDHRGCIHIKEEHIIDKLRKAADNMKGRHKSKKDAEGRPIPKGTPIAPSLSQHFNSHDGDAMNGRNIDPKAVDAIDRKLERDFVYIETTDGPTFVERAATEAAAELARTTVVVTEDVPRITASGDFLGMVTVKFRKYRSGYRKILSIIADTTPDADITRTDSYRFENKDDIFDTLPLRDYNYYKEELGYDGDFVIQNYDDESESESDDDDE